MAAFVSVANVYSQITESNNMHVIEAINSYNNILASNLDCATNPPDFNKLSFQDANAAVVADVRKQVSTEYITILVDKIRHANLNPTNKVFAIYLLGMFHSNDTNAIEVLIESIDFKAVFRDYNLDVSRWGMYPAQEALIKIGRPTVNPIMAHLLVETDELRRHLMCEVLRRVDSRESVQIEIRKILAAELDSNRQANLKLALKEFDN
jgi:hypothetical protein